MKYLNIALSVVGIVSSLAIFVQIFLIKKQMKNGYEKSRREKTVDLLIVWTKSLNKETIQAKKIVESLSDKQCMDLYNNIPFEVDPKIRDKLCIFCSEKVCKDCEAYQECNGRYKVSNKQLANLRFHAVTFLNTLESILVAWQSSIVDDQIICAQFGYLFNQQEGKDLMYSMRKACGGVDSYPAIAAFYDYLQSEKMKGGKKKAKIS